MTARRRRTWTTFGVCVAVVGFALFWVNRELLDMERRELLARGDARVQEAMRLALWRMDSALAPVLAQEAARAPSEYPPATGGPAPLTAFEPFRLYFSIDAEGHASSPEIAPFLAALRPVPPPPPPPATIMPPPPPEQEQEQLKPESAPSQKKGEKKGRETVDKAGKLDSLDEGTLAKGGDSDDESARGRRLDDGAWKEPPASRPAAPPPAPPRVGRGAAANPKSPLDSDVRPELKSAPRPSGRAAPPPAAAAAPQAAPAPQRDTSEVGKSNDDYQVRAKMAQEVTEQFEKNVRNQQSLNTALLTQIETGMAGLAMVVADVESGPLEPRWLGATELFLVRAIYDRNTGQPSVQGIKVDWPKFESWLLDKTLDLFPNGRLAPVRPSVDAKEGALLATIPVAFVPGAAAVVEEAPSSTRNIMLFAWIAALGAITAVGLVLRAALSLGDRRGRFVSAVTHELRTPLTTFRMYSQMLADGMVAESARPEYLATLRDESERLSRVVESVLLYSRLEEGRGGAHREKIACRALVDRILPALGKRASDGGLSLATIIEVDREAVVDVDVQAVEQILLNLVDNACKYAAPADKRVEIRFRTGPKSFEARCRDWGPGIPDSEHQAVFLPFRRGARDEAGTTPGVGLGLALARGLAEALGGSLVLEALPDPGASFVLTIPLSSS